MLAGAAISCLALGLLAAPALAAPAWLAPLDLSAAGQNAYEPQVAMGSQGDAVAVWETYVGEDWIVQSAVRPAGGTWQAPVDLSAAGQNEQEPQVAVDSQGNAVAVWDVHEEGEGWIVQSAARPAGGTWQAPLDLSAGSQYQHRPQVAIDAQGDAFAVWQWREGSASFIIQSAMRPAGGGWQAPVDLTLPDQPATDPAVAVDPQGNAVAVWERKNDGTNWTVQSALRPAGGSWQPGKDVSDPLLYAYEPQVAVDPQGDTVVVWECTKGANYLIQSAIQPAGGSWQAPVDVSEAGQEAIEAQVAIDSQGNGMAVWQTYNGTHEIVQSARMPAGGEWEAPVSLSDEGEDAYHPQVVMDSQGNAIAVWERWDGASDTVQAALRPAGAGWQARVDVSATGQDAIEPEVAGDSQGNAIAVWRNSNGETTSSRAQAMTPRHRNCALSRFRLRGPSGSRCRSRSPRSTSGRSA